MKSDPLFHPLLTQYEDLQQRELNLGIQPGTPILLDSKLNHDIRLIKFFNSAVWRSLHEGTRETYRTVYRPFFEFMHRRGRDIWTADEEDIALWKIARTDATVNPTGFVQGATWNKEISALDVLFKWASNPRRGYMISNPLDDLPNQGRAKNTRKRRASPQEQNERGTKFMAKNARAYRGIWLSPATYAGESSHSILLRYPLRKMGGKWVSSELVRLFFSRRCSWRGAAPLDLTDRPLRQLLPNRLELSPLHRRPRNRLLWIPSRPLMVRLTTSSTRPGS